LATAAFYFQSSNSSEKDDTEQIASVSDGQIADPIEALEGIEETEEVQSIEEQNNEPEELESENVEQNENQEAQDDKESAEESEEKNEGEETQYQNTDDLVIGIMADAHYSPEKCTWKVSSFIKSVSYHKPNFIIQLGDMIDSRVDGDRRSNKEGIEDFKKINAQYSGYSLRYHVLGNHDLLSISKKDYENLTGFDNYYSFKSGDYNIIVLDTNYDADDDDIGPKHDDVAAYKGRLSDNEREWLKGKLKGHSKNIIFSHHPVYNLSNKDEVEDIIDKYDDNVVFLASGHQHRAGTQRVEDIKSYDIPSICYQSSYAIVRVNGSSSAASFLSI
jgi:predicted phosphodiesterase